MTEYVEGLVPALRQLHEEGDVRNALRLVEAITDIVSDTATVQTAAALLDVGDTFYGGSLDAPLGCLSAARAIFADSGFEHGVGACDVVAADLAAATEHEDRALKLYEAGLEALDSELEPSMVGRAWHNLAILLRRLERPTDSLEAQHKALIAYRQTGGATQTADCHVGLGRALHDLGRADEALEPYAAARALFLEFGEDAAVADVDDLRGLALCDLGRFEEAAAAHDAAAVRYSSVDDAWSAARSRRYRSHALDHAGQWEDALAELDAARAIFSEAEDVVEMARCDAASAAALIGLGQLAAAKALLDSARRALAEGGLEDEADWCAALLADPAKLKHGHPGS